MSKNTSRRRVLALNSRYTWLDKDGARRVCFYCGDPADSVDHCPALAVAYAWGTENLLNSGVSLLLIPSCRECNLLLGDRPVLTPAARGEFLNKKLSDRYKKFLGGTFNEKDLTEYGVNLRSVLERHMNIKTWIERRLHFTSRFYQI